LRGHLLNLKIKKMENLQQNKADELIKETEIKLQQHIEAEAEVVEDPYKNLILEEISRYSPHSEVLTLSTLLALSQGVHICNISPPGQGKSRNTVELLKLLRIPFSLIAGHTTPRQFFSELEKDGIIVVDEGATILSDKNIINLLLNALWNGKVEWKNNKELKSHMFKGLIIFNVNKLSNTGLTEALKDRIFVNEVNLSTNEIRDKIMASREYKPNMEIWAEIRERLELDIVSQNLTSKRPQKFGTLGVNNPKISQNSKNLTKFDIIFEKVYHLIENGDEIKSVREIKKLHELAMFSYTLVGDLSLIDYFRKTDEIWKILNMPIKKSEKVKLIAEAKCITERHAYRIIQKFENENEN
jgi:hypothetical protein